MTVEEVVKKAEIDEITVGKIYQLHQNSEHKRLLPQKPSKK